MPLLYAEVFCFCKLLPYCYCLSKTRNCTCSKILSDKAIFSVILLYCKEDAIRKQQEGAFRKVIILVPSDVGIFKKLLLSKKQAKIKLTFRDGHIEIKEWNARSFTEKSDVLNNIRSKTWWREKDSLGIIKVEVTIV